MVTVIICYNFVTLIKETRVEELVVSFVVLLLLLLFSSFSLSLLWHAINNAFKIIVIISFIVRFFSSSSSCALAQFTINLLLCKRKKFNNASRCLKGLRFSRGNIESELERLYVAKVCFLCILLLTSLNPPTKLKLFFSSLHCSAKGARMKDWKIFFYGRSIL